MSHPEQTSSTPPVVSDNKMAEEGQGPSPVVDDSTVMACDEEDGVSYVTSPSLLVVSYNKMAEEGQSPSPMVDDSIAMAHDEEGGVSNVTSPTLPVVSNNKTAEEGRSPSPVVADPIVFARDDEDGVSYVQRLVGVGGPTERGEGELIYACVPFHCSTQEQCGVSAANHRSRHLNPNIQWLRSSPLTGRLTSLSCLPAD